MVMEGSRPGRASSTRPSRRCSTNRDRHLPTVAVEHRRSAATLVLSAPAAHASTMRERSARDCVDFARRTHRCNCSRSESVNTSSALGRPVLAMVKSNTYRALHWRRTLVLGVGSSWAACGGWVGAAPLVDMGMSLPTVLPEVDRCVLAARVKAGTTAQRDVLRAKIVLSMGDLSQRGCAKALGCSRTTVSTWRARYRAWGLAGLVDRPRSGAPRTYTDAQARADAGSFSPEAAPTGSRSASAR